jgi:hypothetical protein
MIAKRVERKQHSSNYATLAHYILDRKGDGQKVRDAWSTNCQTPDDFDLAIKEVTSTQALNTRSRIDKSYHLVVSLAPGEDLTTDQWKEVEAAFCKAIGLSEHQRICAIHSDTDHVHLHIAISKVHPIKLTCVEPYYDKFKLQDTCRQLEHPYGLVPGIADGKKILTPAQEAHQGLEAFSTYIKDNIAAGLRALLSEQGGTWRKAQDLCGRFGVEIREHGAGLVFSHAQKKLFVKASAIDRSFSKGKLEAAFGSFEKSAWSGAPEKVYSPAPVGRDNKASGLFDEYTKLREKERMEYLKKSSNLSSDRAQKLLEIKERYARRRQEIKRDTLIARGRKREIYRKVSEQMKKELEKLYAAAPESVAEARSGLKTKSWREFAHERASAGDEIALGILRSKRAPCKDFGDGAFVGRGRNNVMVSGVLKEVHSDGSIEYQTSGGSFFDLGDAIVFKKSGSEETLKAALLVAQAKFGDDFTLKGPAEFMEKAGLHLAKSRKDLERKGGQSKGKDLTM